MAGHGAAGEVDGAEQLARMFRLAGLKASHSERAGAAVAGRGAGVDFDSAVMAALVAENYDPRRHSVPVRVAREVVRGTTPLVVLLSGTSGTGKSTLAFLLAERLGVSRVVTSDAVRHQMLTEPDLPGREALAMSTYEAFEARGTDGYMDQARPVAGRIARVLSRLVRDGRSAIVEGVHLHTEFCVEQMRRAGALVVPFCVHISNREKHRERFAVRAKHMTLDPAHNRYVKHFDSIRAIQDALVTGAERRLLPRIDNTNVDRSVVAVHSVIVRCMRHAAAGRPLLDAATGRAVLMNEEYLVSHDEAWSSKAMRTAIKEKNM